MIDTMMRRRLEDGDRLSDGYFELSFEHRKLLEKRDGFASSLKSSEAGMENVLPNKRKAFAFLILLIVFSAACFVTAFEGVRMLFNEELQESFGDLLFLVCLFALGMIASDVMRCHYRDLAAVYMEEQRKALDAFRLNEDEIGRVYFMMKAYENAANMEIAMKAFPGIKELPLVASEGGE